MTTSQYSDLDFNFIEHPGLKNILPKTDVEAVKRAVRNLFLMSFGEKPFHPERAIGIRQYLFEPLTHITIAKIQRDIIQILAQYEPRVSVIDLNFGPLNDEGRLEITMIFTVINIPDPVTITFYLDRNR